MRARLPFLVLVVCSIAFIASLYLPWSVKTLVVVGPLRLTSHRTLDGWSAIAQIGALAAVALAASAALRPAIALRLPLGRFALVLAYFAVATMLQVRTVGQELQRSTPHDPVPYHLTYGAYLGLATAGVALLTAVVLRRGEMVRRWSWPEGAVAALSLAVLAADLLPGCARTATRFRGRSPLPKLSLPWRCAPDCGCSRPVCKRWRPAPSRS